MNNITGFENLDVMFTHQTSRLELINLLKKDKKPYFGYGIAKDLEYTNSKIIRDYYPYKIFQKNYYAGTFKIFSKIQSDSIRSINDTIFFNNIDFKAHVKGWNLKDSSRLLHNSNGTINVYLMDSLIEFGPSFTTASHAGVINSRNTIVTAKASITPVNKTTINPILVVSIRDTIKNEMVMWKGVNATGFRSNDSLFTIYNSFRIGEMGNMEEKLFDCYLWNREKETFIINEISFSSWYGNPFTYAIFQPITSNPFMNNGTWKNKY
jgi:hypothetical protein